MSALKSLGLIYLTIAVGWFVFLCGVQLWGALGLLIGPIPATLVCLPVFFVIVIPDLRFIALFHIGLAAKLIGLHIGSQRPQWPSQSPLLPGRDRAWPQLPAPSRDREES